MTCRLEKKFNEYDEVEHKPSRSESRKVKREQRRKDKKHLKEAIFNQATSVDFDEYLEY